VRKRSANLQRESNLERSLAPFRVGSVEYLNAVPLTRAFEEEVIFATLRSSQKCCAAMN
jgi:hypothetical protein